MTRLEQRWRELNVRRSRLGYARIEALKRGDHDEAARLLRNAVMLHRKQDANVGKNNSRNTRRK